MPRASRNPCPCGCGQPATTVRASPTRRVVVQGSRTRIAECSACGARIRSTRADFALGVHACRCGLGALLPICLEDRCALPGPDGDTAWEEYAGRAVVSAQQAEYGRRSGGGERSKARAELRRRMAASGLDQLDAPPF